MSEAAPTKVITRAQYLQLLGLQLIAERHLNALRDAERAARELVGVEEEGSLIDDAMWGSRTIDEVLAVSDIKVADE